MTGVLDTAGDAGTARLELPALDDLATGAQADGEGEAASELAALADLQMSWTAEQLTLLMGGKKATGPRNDTDSGVLARVPGEPAGLFDVVAAAEVTVQAREDLDGVHTTRLRGSAQPKAAVSGLGTQAHLSIATLPALPVEVWVDDSGRPARIRYTVTLPSLQQGRSRTLVTTYDYRDWGEPVDVTP